MDKDKGPKMVWWTKGLSIWIEIGQGGPCQATLV